MEFTKEQLIAHIKKQMKMREMHIASPATEQAFREYLELEIATNEIALASLDAGSDSHPAHGPVSLDRLHRIREILSKAAAQSNGGNVGYAMSDAVKAIDELLDVRKAEPAGYHVIKECGKVGCSVATLEEAEKTREFWNKKWTIKPYFYTAPPAPVVPEAKCDDDGNTTSEFDHGWNACRATMLNHSVRVTDMVEHVSPPYKLPPHVYRELVNQLHSTAMKYGGCQQLRDQISRTLRTVMTPSQVD